MQLFGEALHIITMFIMHLKVVNRRQGILRCVCDTFIATLKENQPYVYSKLYRKYNTQMRAHFLSSIDVIMHYEQLVLLVHDLVNQYQDIFIHKDLKAKHCKCKCNNIAIL